MYGFSSCVTVFVDVLNQMQALDPFAATKSLTVHRDHPPDGGGHFYIGSYKLRIQAAPNTLVVWIPSDVHGTSLQDLDPKDLDPDFLQTGIAIVTPNRLPSVWTKFCESEMKYQDMVSNVIRDLGDDHGDENL